MSNGLEEHRVRFERDSQVSAPRDRTAPWSLLTQAFHTASWLEGTNETLSGRFAALRARHFGGNAGKERLRFLGRLLIK